MSLAARAQRRRAAGLVAIALMISPGVAHAASFRGLGILVAAIFVGLPAAALLIAMVIASYLIGARPAAKPRTLRLYGGFALVASIACVLAYPLASLAFEGQIDGDSTGLMLAAWVPLLGLGAWSAVLAQRLRGRGAAG